MGITITAIQLIGGVDHRHVAALRWVCDDTGRTGDSATAAVVDWLSDDGNIAWVGRERLSTLQVVDDLDGPHLRANRVGEPTRDLLDLPRLPLYSDQRATDSGSAVISGLESSAIGDDGKRERRRNPDAATLP
jgi:hypothetical protein